MINLSTIQTPILNSQIQQFHLSVNELATEYGTSSLDRFFKRVIRFFTHTTDRGNLHAVTAKKIHDLTDQAELILKLTQSHHKSSISRKNLNLFSRDNLNLFSRDIEKLYKKIYPHLHIPCFSSKNKMPLAVQNYLSPQLKKLREEKKANPKLAIDPEHRAQRKMLKGRLSEDLGSIANTSKGENGTRLVKDINGKYVGIHKIGTTHLPILVRIKNFIKSIGWGQLVYLSRHPLAQPFSERAAFLLSSTLKFDVAPATIQTTERSGKGIFQVFIHKEKTGLPAKTINVRSPIDGSYKEIESDQYVEAQLLIEDVDVKHHFSEREKTEFQKFAIFDYIIGNLDRHEENWFITVESNNNELEITNIKAIDNANAFPKKMPEKNVKASRKQFKWKIRNIAQQSFTPETQAFVKEHLPPNKILDLIKVIKRDMPDFLDKKMEELLAKRALLAYKLVQQHSETPASLADHSTLKEINSYIKRNN